MHSTLKWKRAAFSTTYKIFNREEQIGHLQDHAFKQTSDGMIRNQAYRFKTEGFFKQKTMITDLQSQEIIGSIEYNSWMNKAEFKLYDRSCHWKYDNGWQTKWSIADTAGKQIRFAGGMTKGIVEGKDPEYLLVLAGLFVTNYYRQVGIAVLLAVFIPIWVSVIN